MFKFLIIICSFIPDDCVKGEIERQPFGVYLQAFCNGLNEVLVPYRKDIADLEEKSLEDPYLPLLTIVSKVEEYTKLFEVINSMIKQVRRFASYLSVPAGHFSIMLHSDAFFKAK